MNLIVNGPREEIDNCKEDFKCSYLLAHTCRIHIRNAHLWYVHLAIRCSKPGTTAVATTVSSLSKAAPRRTFIRNKHPPFKRYRHTNVHSRPPDAPRPPERCHRSWNFAFPFRVPVAIGLLARARPAMMGKVAIQTSSCIRPLSNVSVFFFNRDLSAYRKPEGPEKKERKRVANTKQVKRTIRGRPSDLPSTRNS